MNKTFFAILNIILICSLIFLTNSCNPLLGKEDISIEKDYNIILGKVYSTQQLLKLYGVKHDITKQTISRYGLVLLPGFSGPEIVHLGTLEIGSRLKVVKVVRTVPTLFWKQNIRFVVEILNEDSFKGLYAEISPAFKAYSKHPTDKDIVILNKSIFIEI